MNSIYLFCIISIAYCNAFYACPTCEGKVKPESPPFFSEDFYQPGASNQTSRLTKIQIAHKEFKKLVESKRVKK